VTTGWAVIASGSSWSPLMHYDLGFFDHKTGRIECAENPFALKYHVSGSESGRLQTGVQL
jgi:hypothetical protein